MEALGGGQNAFRIPECAEAHWPDCTNRAGCRANYSTTRAGHRFPHHHDSYGDCMHATSTVGSGDDNGM